jgi:hypothetical protein
MSGFLFTVSEFLLKVSEFLFKVSEFPLEVLEASLVVVELSVHAVFESLLLTPLELLLAYESVELVPECKKEDWLLSVAAVVVAVVGESGTKVT